MGGREKTVLILCGLSLLCGSCLATLNVALVEFVLFGNRTTTSLAVAGVCLDLGETELREKYSSILNVTRVRIFDVNVTTCEMMDQKATFWVMDENNCLTGNPSWSLNPNFLFIGNALFLSRS